MINMNCSDYVKLWQEDQSENKKEFDRLIKKQMFKPVSMGVRSFKNEWEGALSVKHKTVGAVDVL